MVMRYPQGVDVAAAMEAGFVLDRCEAVPALIGRAEDFLIVTGLAGTARDIAALTHDSARIYTMAGAMGGAAMIGLGLALARPDKRVLVATGDGEILMNIGALATIAVLNPANLSISRRLRSAPVFSAPARLPPNPSLRTAPGCCAKATAPPLSCCASRRPNRPPTSAISILPPAACGSRGRCSETAEKSMFHLAQDCARPRSKLHLRPLPDDHPYHNASDHASMSARPLPGLCACPTRP
jgi:hypothetical protein